MVRCTPSGTGCAEVDQVGGRVPSRLLESDVEPGEREQQRRVACPFGIHELTPQITSLVGVVEYVDDEDERADACGCGTSRPSGASGL